MEWQTILDIVDATFPYASTNCIR